VSREFHSSENAFQIGYVELAARYEFERPNDGRIVTSPLTEVATSPWSGSIRTGIRSLLSARL
jgi:hypothetical protein